VTESLKSQIKGLEESETFEVEVVDESPPPHFNPPLTGPNDPILVQVRDLFSEPFSLFSDPHTDECYRGHHSDVLLVVP
jgi:hypothetical protein